jgi:phosphate transport system permease protein
MIVLLATGNTPIMEASLLSGLRSLSASIAVELPEAGTASVQFRVLFLAALVLFALTFVLNTVAELFRQRLRYSYARR